MTPSLMERASSSLQGMLSKWLCDVHTLQLAQWQTMAFRLPLAQEEASVWWVAPHSLSGLHHWDFLPHIDPPAQGTSRLLGRKKSWPWLNLCNVVQRGQGHLPESCATQHGTFKGVWHPWCGWTGMKLWSLHYWDPQMTNLECPQYWRKKLYSWGVNWSPRRLQRLLHPPWIPRNPWTQRTNQAVCCSKPIWPFIYGIKFP